MATEIPVKTNRGTNTRKLTRLALLGAISIVLVAAIRIPFPPAPFLELDFGLIPILMGTFAYGPLAGLGLTAVVAIIQGTTVSAGSGVIGIIMQLMSTGSFVLVSGLIYKRKKDKKSAIIGLTAGSIALTIGMTFFNLIFTPIFMGTPIQAVVGMLVPIIIPFNILRASINSVITFILYKSLSKYLK